MNELGMAPVSVIPPAAPRTVARKWLVALIALVVLLGVAVAGYWFVKNSTLAFRGAHYLSGTYENRVVAAVGWRTAAPVTFSVPGHVYDYAANHGVEAVIAASAKDTDDVYVVQKNSSVALTKDGGIKSALAVSLDGAHIAYAKRTSAATSTNAADFYAPSAWNIIVSNADGKNSRVVGAGYAPQFFSRDGHTYLAYLTETSIHLVDLSTNAHQDIPVSFGKLTSLHTAAISSDGTAILLPSVDNSYALYALKYTNGLATLSAIGPLPDKTDLAVFMGDNSILSLARINGRSYLRLSPREAPAIITHTMNVGTGLIVKITPQ